jgi:hypothetical protein
MKEEMNDKIKSIINRYIDGEKHLYSQFSKLAKTLQQTDNDCYSLYLKAYIKDDIVEMMKQKNLILKEHKQPKLKKDII